jgi:hypothetical protein
MTAWEGIAQAIADCQAGRMARVAVPAVELARQSAR